MKPLLLNLNLPEYQVNDEPDHRAVGKIVDDELKKYFMGQNLVVRGVSLSGHPGKTADELIRIIEERGTDRYDPDRAGDRYENVGGKHIDFFAFRRKITPKTKLFKDISWGFYHGGKTIHGEPIRIDLLTIYDAAQLKTVLHRYEGRTDFKRDGFVFRDPTNKKVALLGILKING